MDCSRRSSSSVELRFRAVTLGRAILCVFGDSAFVWSAIYQYGDCWETRLTASVWRGIEKGVEPIYYRQSPACHCGSLHGPSDSNNIKILQNIQ